MEVKFSFGQKEIEPLAIGEKFPNYNLYVEDKDSTYSLNLEKYSGKHILLDLWNVYCAGCVSGIKKLDSLQRMYSDKLQVILITKNSRDEVNKLFSRKNVYKPNLPLVVGDTIVYDKFFPHDGDPLHIWIDPSGEIKYITGGYNTTSENLEKFFKQIPLKVSFQSKLKDFDDSAPLLKEVSSRLNYYTGAYSLYTVGLHNHVNSNRIELKKGYNNYVTSIKALNTPLLILCQLAYNKELYGFDLNMFRLNRNNRILLNSEKAQRMKIPHETNLLDEWNDSNLYSYELMVPEKKLDDIYKWMQLDLKRYFDLNISIEKRTVKAIVLREISFFSKIHKLNKNNSSWNDRGFTKYNGRENMKLLVEQIIYATQNLGFPFVDETTLDIKDLVKIPAKFKNLDELNSILKCYGFRLSIEKKNIEMLVIK